MAVVLALRVAIMLTPVVTRWAASGGSPPTQGFTLWLQEHWNVFSDPAKSAPDVTAELQASLDEGSFVLVADVPGPFELRKLQVRWDRTPPAGPVQDVDVCTFHFLKAPGGTPTNAWLDSDYATLETAFGAYWTAIKPDFPTWQHLDQYRWYADGPAFYHQVGGSGPFVPIGDNPARRVTEVDVPGTSGATSPLPPQCSITVTEITSGRKHWGRWYLPACGASTVMGSDGRVLSGIVTALLGAAVTFYNAARTASLIPVVFSIQKPDRPTARGGTLPAVGAVAYEVVSLQMDDIVDVIRSRRYDRAVNKPRTALT